MQVLQYLFLGAQHAGLVTGDTSSDAEADDELTRLTQLVAWHGREEVMLNLIIQSAVHKVGDWIGPDVAGGEHLLAQEVQPCVLV